MHKLTQDAIDGLVHPDYNFIVNNTVFYKQIVTGELQTDLIVNLKSRESDEQKAQRVVITMNRTKSISSKIEGYYKHTFRPDKLVFEVSHENEDENAKIQPHNSSFGNDGQSVLVWSEEAALFQNGIDPNAFYWMKRRRIKENGQDVLTFDPFIFTSKQVRLFELEKGLVKSCVCKLSQSVKFIGEKKSSHSKELHIFYTFVKDGLETAVEFNKDVKKHTDFYDKFIVEGAESKEEIYREKTYLVTFSESEIDTVPVSRMGYSHDKRTHGRTYVPYWEPATEEFRILVNDGSIFDVSKMLHGFPMKFTYYVTCNFTDASGGYCKQGTIHPSGAECRACNGTGEIVHVSSQDIVKIRMPTEDEPQMVKPSDFAAYVKQPSEALSMQNELVEKAEPKIIRSVFGVDIAQKNNVAVTATEVRNQDDTAQDALAEFTKAPQRLFLFTIRTQAKYLEIENIQAALVYPNEFNLKSEQELLVDLKSAKDAGASPIIINSISNKIIQKQNRNNPSFLSLHKVMSQFLPFGNLSKELLDLHIMNMPNQSVQKAKFLNYDEIMKDILANHPTFLLMEYKEQGELIDAKAQVFVDAAMKENSVREIAGINITDPEVQEE